MKHFVSLNIIICSFLLFSCSTAPETPFATPPPPISPTATLTQQPATFALSEPGPYRVGIRRGTRFDDSNRDNRLVIVTLWYPAIAPQDEDAKEPFLLADPDPAGAPYPIVLSSAKVGAIFGPHLASYGFIMVGISGQDSARHWGNWLTDYPLDLVFALDQLSSSPPEELIGIMDTEHAGAMGYSFDGYTSLALSGARIDPEFYLSKCADPTPSTALPAWWIDYICNMTDDWDAFVANAGPSLTETDDGLWQPITDARIRAVMPMAPEGAWLFGERGLAAADRPTLIIAASADDINLYNTEAVYIFDHLGVSDKTMLSFVGEGHMMVYEDEPILRMKHFATAFFSYHLKSDETFAELFSKEFVAQFDNLAWGAFMNK